MTPEINPNKTYTFGKYRYDDDLWVRGPTVDPLQRARTIEFNVTEDIEAYITVDIRETEIGCSGYQIIFQIYVNVNDCGWQQIFRDTRHRDSEESAYEFAVTKTQRIIEEPTVQTFVNNIEDNYIR